MSKKGHIVYPPFGIRLQIGIINMKYIITESQYNKMIDRFISSRFEGFDVKKTPKYPDSIFWDKDGVIIAEIENSSFFIIKREIWNIISKMFSLSHEETKLALQNWLEKHYQLGKLLPQWIAAPFDV